jgi:hypothetical protein
LGALGVVGDGVGLEGGLPLLAPPSGKLHVNVPTTRLCRCWPRGVAGPGPAGCGCRCAMTVPRAASRRRRCCSATPPTARGSARRTICGCSGASCRRIAMPATVLQPAPRQ